VGFRSSTKNNSRFGLQSGLRDAMERERWTCKLLADQLDVPYFALYAVIIGRSAPSAQMREELPAILHQPARALFTPRVLAANPGAHRPGPKSGREKRPA
jgi:hypothetical protein